MQLGGLNLNKDKILNKITLGLILFLVLPMLLRTSHAKAEIISTDRKVDWSQVGVSGDIPTTRPTCTVSINAATYGNGSTDATTTIQNGLNSCAGKVLFLPIGTYKISASLKVPSNTTLRGAGIGKTIIKNSTSVVYLAGFDNNTGISPNSFNITAGNTKGSTSITLDTAARSLDWQVGDLILVDQLEDPNGTPPISSTGTGNSMCTWCSRASGTRPAGQVAKVTAIAGSVATLELPLNRTYNKQPQAVKLTGITSNAGIENITFDSGTICPNDNYGTVSDINSDNSWLLNVETINICRMGVQVASTYRNTLRGLVVHETTHHTSNGGYGLYMMGAGSANLIDNSIFYNILLGIVLEGAISENVIAYNFYTHMWNTDYPGKASSGISIHGAQPMMNLFEGNYFDGPQIILDSYWGYSAYDTFFRNRQITNTYPYDPVNQLFGVQLYSNSQFMNFVGNVLGQVGYEALYESDFVWSGIKGIFYLEPTTSPSILRHGNWVSIDKNGVPNVQWDANIADHNIPNSLYLTAKPAWWGTSAWPGVGPELAVNSNLIPAKTTYDTLYADGTAPAPTCTSLTFQAGSASPASVNTNGTYAISCNYGMDHIDSINASNDLGDCVYSSWNGTAAVFNCNAGLAGTRTNRCWIKAGTAANNCAQTNVVNSVAVKGNWSVSDFITLTQSWLTTTTPTEDFNKDGIVNSKDLGIVMSNWN